MSPLGSEILAGNARLTLTCAGDAGSRGQVLAFIRQCFLDHFGAEVDDDSPTLVGAFDADLGLVAAFGLRDAASGFFCEQYLDRPLEQALRSQLAHPVRRDQVVELTHLCAVRPGCLGTLAALLPAALIERGYRYLACTATACVGAYLIRKGLPAVHLGAASASALPADQADRWGRYYDADPRVLAGDLRLALAPRAGHGDTRVAC